VALPIKIVRTRLSVFQLAEYGFKTRRWLNLINARHKTQMTSARSYLILTQIVKTLLQVAQMDLYSLTVVAL
jgi:hypothetical protein